MRRHVVERWSASLGACALAGSYYFYVLLWVVPRNGGPQLDGVLRAVVDGTADAPYQYRFLVPCVLEWVRDHTALSLGQATVLVDGTAMAVGAIVGFALLKRAGLGLYALPAGLYCAYLCLGISSRAKPETITAFACVTLALIALARRSSDDGWWPPRVVWPVLLIATVVLLGCRTDLVVALAAGFAVRYRAGKDPVDAVAMVGLAVVGVAGSLFLIMHFREARYPAGVSVLQLSYNFDALPIVVAALFLLPAVAPVLMMWRHQTAVPATRRALAAQAPLLAVIFSELGATFVVGHIDEIRLMFPVAFALAWVGIDLWRALLSTLEIEDRTRSMTVE